MKLRQFSHADKEAFEKDGYVILKGFFSKVESGYPAPDGTEMMKPLKNKPMEWKIREDRQQN
ncbi:MAG: hypothetical protein WKF59_26315 [Chitinophagaceae bacterium]